MRRDEKTHLYPTQPTSTLHLPNPLLGFLIKLLIQSRGQLMIIPPIEIEEPSLQIGLGLVLGIALGRLRKGIAGFILVTVFVPCGGADPAELVIAVTAENPAVWRVRSVERRR
jgi:hypothetical protein